MALRAFLCVWVAYAANHEAPACVADQMAAIGDNPTCEQVAGLDLSTCDDSTKTFINNYVAGGCVDGDTGSGSCTDDCTEEPTDCTAMETMTSAGGCANDCEPAVVQTLYDTLSCTYTLETNPPAVSAGSGSSGSSGTGCSDDCTTEPTDCASMETMTSAGGCANDCPASEIQQYYDALSCTYTLETNPPAGGSSGSGSSGSGSSGSGSSGSGSSGSGSSASGSSSSSSSSSGSGTTTTSSAAVAAVLLGYLA